MEVTVRKTIITSDFETKAFIRVILLMLLWLCFLPSSAIFIKRRRMSFRNLNFDVYI